MRTMTIAVLMIVVANVHAQSNVWKSVGSEIALPRLQVVTPSDAQLNAIAAMLRHADQDDIWACEGDARKEMIQGLTYEAIPLTPGGKVLLVQAGAGCARGGQGSNGAMWLIRFEGEKPVLMASPKGGFNGWLYSIQPTTSHGYRDIVLGWHMSAFEAGLTYFRFDGKSYAAIGSATRKEDENEEVTILPKRR